MASLGYNPVQSVALNQGAIFDTMIACPYGFVLHENQTPYFILRGATDYPCQRFARYKVTAISNIAIPTGGTVTPIAVALTVMGAVRADSRAIVTPAAVDEYFNVTCSDFIDVPKGCCFLVGIANVAASDDPTYVAAPTINMQNLNITVDRIAV